MPDTASLVRLWRSARRVLVFTGAGISTGSGIPDFRGPQGTWTKRQPVLFQEFMASEEGRIAHWEYKLEGREAFRQARPNAAHRALAELDRLGRIDTLVTQNIDGLHHAAGHAPEKIIELHGTNRLVQCMTCGALSDPKPAFDEFLKSHRCPRCACGGFLKAATISFGQPMPQDLLRRAFAAAEEADFVVSLGSTLGVEPAASVPRIAAERGAAYAVINRGETAHDALATLRIGADVNEILPAVVAGILGG